MNLLCRYEERNVIYRYSFLPWLLKSSFVVSSLHLSVERVHMAADLNVAVALLYPNEWWHYFAPYNASIHGGCAKRNL